MTLPIYESGQAKDYCNAKGWKYKTSGDHLVLKTCPVGGHDGDKFYLNNASGLWDCKAASCAQSGNFYQLLKFQGDTPDVAPLSSINPAIKVKKTFTLDSLQPFREALRDSPEAIRYLSLRGLTLETAEAHYLGYKDKDGIQQLMIPYIRDGIVVDVKYRLLPASEDGIRPKYGRLAGGESVLYGEQQLPAAAGETLYLVEGEMDALTMWQHGLRPVLSTTTGASSFKTEWYDAIIAAKPAKIVLCYDTDAAGQIGAEKLRSRLEGEIPVTNLVLGEGAEKDVNEYFLTHTAGDFKALVKLASEPVEIENVKSMFTVNNLLEEQLWFSTEAFDGVPSQFTDLNAMVEGGYWNGQLVVISGPSGTGKTSLVLQELLWLSKDKGLPTYLLCLEMPEIMMMRKIYLKEFAIPMLKLTHAHVKELRGRLDEIPLFLGSKCRKLADVEKTIRTAVSRYGLKMVCFDNINYFVRSIESQAQEIAACTKLLKDLAIELNIPIIAISQPKKFDRDQRMMNTGDLAWSSAIEQDADTIILLHRQAIKTDLKDFGKNAGGMIGNQSPFTLVRVAKARYAGGGETYLYFDGSRSTYRELTDTEKVAMQHG